MPCATIADAKLYDMKTLLLPNQSKRLLRRFLPSAHLVALLFSAFDLREADAQTTGETAREPANPANAEKPAPNFQVLKRHEIVVGDHTVTFQLVVPPQTPAPAAPAPVARELSHQELEAQQRREAKSQKVLFFSATALDHRITELRWLDGGKSYRAFSNIDFQYFSGLTEIETEDSVCTLMMALDTGTAEALAERTRDISQVSLLPKDRAAWLLVDGSAEEGASVVTAWDSIHRYFDAHRAEMIRGYEQRQAAKAESERLEREKPPASKNRVITYWKKNSAPRPQSREDQP